LDDRANSKRTPTELAETLRISEHLIRYPQSEIRDGTRAAVYHALAEALAGPVPEIQDLLLGAVRIGAQALDSEACRRAALALAELPLLGLETLRESYSRLTAGHGQRPPALYESLHRQGRLAGPVTWDVERHYRAFGLTPAEGELPDHASVELAFLAYLTDAEAEARAAGDGRRVARLRAEQRRFLREHAGAWLPEVGAELAAADEPFYAIVGRLLSEFLSEELSGGRRAGQTGIRLPALRDVTACTLCGLCVGSCPLDALRVVESATETVLRLDPARCVGCDRCVGICPEGVLFLAQDGRVRTQTEAAKGADYRILRRSPRATCPNCGRPTVSQAELEAVFVRLEADSALQRRLSLCVACKSWDAYSKCGTLNKHCPE